MHKSKEEKLIEAISTLGITQMHITRKTTENMHSESYSQEIIAIVKRLNEEQMRQLRDKNFNVLNGSKVALVCCS